MHLRNFIRKAFNLIFFSQVAQEKKASLAFLLFVKHAAAYHHAPKCGILWHMDSFSLAFLLCTLAGLSTGVGGLLCLFKFSSRRSFMPIALAFSCGVMIYVSFGEIMNKASDGLGAVVPEPIASFYLTAFFFIGIAATALINTLLPDEGTFAVKPHRMLKSGAGTSDLLKTGIITSAALVLHNMPEGLATFLAVYDSPETGAAVVFAIALHNIPEGIAVYAPIYMATKSKTKAFTVSLLSGLTEPLGALIGFAVFGGALSEAVFGAIYAAVAGIMIYISLRELYPLAISGKVGAAYSALFIGMFVMAVSLLLFKL